MMNNIPWALFLNLLLAHLLSDFCLQTDVMVADKVRRSLTGWAIYVHVLTVGIVSCLIVGSLHFWPYALLIVGSHIVIDLAKVKFRKYSLWAFILDQIGHIAVLWWVAIRFQKGWSQYPFISMSWEVTAPAICVALVMLTSPANILIREIFDARKAPLKDFQILSDERRGEIPRMKDASAFIGILERILTFFFVLRGNYEAVGFIVAAKSILRFKESEGARAEYVLVGTLLSVVIAVSCAIFVQCVDPNCHLCKVFR